MTILQLSELRAREWHLFWDHLENHQSSCSCSKHQATKKGQNINVSLHLVTYNLYHFYPNECILTFLIRRDYGKEYVVGVGFGDTEYIVEMYLEDGHRTNIAFTWHPDHGLKVSIFYTINLQIFSTILFLLYLQMREIN